MKVTIWNEFVHEQEQNACGETCRKHYPHGIHEHLKQALGPLLEGAEIRTASLDQPECGLTDDVINSTDVLFWWGHMAHDRVPDAIVAKLHKRVLQGMGLIVMHSGHYSKIFTRLMGTSCSLRWREIGEKERLWAVNPAHPIVQGVPLTFTVDNTEMYGEPFGIPSDGEIIYLSWYEGGNVFRSGVTFKRGAGKIFYFSPGHETFPIYHNENIIKVLANAAKWACPELPPQKTNCWDCDPPTEKVFTPNPNDVTAGVAQPR